MTPRASLDFPTTLLVTRNFPPLRGGMERLNAHMFDALCKANPNCALLGPAGSKAFAPSLKRAGELAAQPLFATLLSSVSRGVAMARNHHVDVVLAGSGLTAPAAVIAAKASKAVPIVYLHGLDIIAPSFIYRTAWLPFIRQCRGALVNSANTRRLAIEAGVDPRRIRIVHPGTHLSTPDPSARARFRAAHGIADESPMLLSIGRLTARKGLAEFVERCLPSIVAKHPDTCLVIIGDEASRALHRGRGAGSARVLATAAAQGMEDKVRFLGPCDEATLAQAYQAADLHLFPVLDLPGDVEGFGMVAIEAAAHGLPTIAFNVGGVSDAVSPGMSGELVSSGDYVAYAEVVAAKLGKVTKIERDLARTFSRSFSWERFGREVMNAIADWT